MRQLFSRLLVVVLLVLACSGAVWGDNLKVTIWWFGWSYYIKEGEQSLVGALNSYPYDKIWGIWVTEGDLEESDWIELKALRTSLNKLQKFTVGISIGSVADIPNTTMDKPYFNGSLRELHIAKLKRVGDYAFSNCAYLESVSLLDAIEIGEGAFYGCESLPSISLPMAKKIGGDAFRGCVGLTSVSLPVVTEIGEEAFRYRQSLTSLELGVTPPDAGRDAFLGCPLVRKLKLVDAHGSPLTGDALANAVSRYRAVEDGDTEDNLWYGWAFEDAPASNLSGTIDGEAFSNAASLEVAMQGKTLGNVKEVTITGGRFQVSDWGFLLEQGQHGLAIEKFTIESSVDKVAYMPDLRYESARYLPKAQHVNIAKIQKIGACAFYGCTGLTSVSLPDAIEIGNSAFRECTGLTSVSLPAATKIGEWAFSGCKSLTSVPLPVATEIGEGAFRYCQSLTSVSLPAATKIGERAFVYCESLTSLQLGATPPSAKLNSFLGCPLVRKLKLLDADGTPLTGDALTNALSRYRAVEDGETEDNLWYVWAFEDAPASNLSGTIEGDAFTNAASLEAAMKDKDLNKVTEVTITGGRFQHSDWLFLLEKGHHGLAIEKFTVESSVDRVAYMPDLSSNSSGYLPKSKKVSIAKLKRVGELAFYGCRNLASVSLPAATEIGGEAFRGCTYLNSVSLPAATKIGKEAFKGCKLFTSLQLGAIPPSVGMDAFADCPNSRTLIITDAAGVPLVGQALAAAGNKYYRDNGASYGWYWYGWNLQDVTKMGSVGIYPSDAGTVSITRKDGGAVVNPGDALAKDELLIVTAASKSGYKYKKTTAIRAKDNGNNEWEVTLMTGLVIFTVEFEKLATLGVTIKTPAGAGEVTITRKDGGAVVSQGDALKEGAVLVVEGKPENGYRVKAITAEGAKKIGDKEWEVTAMTGEVIFTVEFEKVATLGATTITPAGTGEATITRKDGWAVVSQGDVLKVGAVLVVEGKPEDGYRVKAITAEGANKIGDKEWEVTAEISQPVIFTVEFEKKAEGEGNNNNNNDPTPVESVLLAQVLLSPNPTGGQVTIDAGTTLARCEVYNSTGVLLQTIETPDSVFTIDLTASPSGVYLVRLVDMKGGCKTLRVVKQ